MFLYYLTSLSRIVLLGYEKIIIKKPINYSFAFYSSISSFIYSFAFVLYVKSLSIANASLVGPLYNFNVFFLLILTFIFLGEKITYLKIFQPFA